MTECRCNGEISKCDHSKHGVQTNFGEIRDLFGVVVKQFSDPTWQCSGCGFPRFAVKKEKQ